MDSFAEEDAKEQLVEIIAGALEEGEGMSQAQLADLIADEVYDALKDLDLGALGLLDEEDDDL